jgi:hypothetical protein
MLLFRMQDVSGSDLDTQIFYTTESFQVVLTSPGQIPESFTACLFLTHDFQCIAHKSYLYLIEINLVNGRFVARPHGIMQSRRLT